jgi:hypothetical protein
MTDSRNSLVARVKDAFWNTCSVGRLTPDMLKPVPKIWEAGFLVDYHRPAVRNFHEPIQLLHHHGKRLQINFNFSGARRQV